MDNKKNARKKDLNNKRRKKNKPRRKNKGKKLMAQNKNKITRR